MILRKNLRMRLANFGKVFPLFVALQGTNGQAQGIAEKDLPRGFDIDPLVANCSIGPFPQTTKAGQYNSLCSIMSDSEKCLAILKAYVMKEARIRNIEERAEYCREHFINELGL